MSPVMDAHGIIRLAPNNPEYIPEEEPAESFLAHPPSRLSTITERTERTEDSRDWGPAPVRMSMTELRTVSSWVTGKRAPLNSSVVDVMLTPR